MTLISSPQIGFIAASASCLPPTHHRYFCKKKWNISCLKFCLLVAALAWNNRLVFLHLWGVLAGIHLFQQRSGQRSLYSNATQIHCDSTCFAVMRGGAQTGFLRRQRAKHWIRNCLSHTIPTAWTIFITWITSHSHIGIYRRCRDVFCSFLCSISDVYAGNITWAVLRTQHSKNTHQSSAGTWPKTKPRQDLAPFIFQE